LERGREGATGEFADDFAFGIEHGVVGARWRAFVRVLKGGELERGALRFLAFQHLAPDEVAFVEFAEKAESCFDRAACGRQVVAIERVAHFEAQRVAGAESTGLGTGAEELVPAGDSLGGRAEEFEAIFAGVAGAADDCPAGRAGNAIAWGQGLARECFGKGGGRLRALDRHTGPCVAVVVEGDSIAEMGVHPGEVLIDHRGIDHQEEVVFAATVGDQVIDHAALRVEQDRVLALADSELADVVGQQAVEPLCGGRATDEELPHVGDVENANLLAHGVMLIDDRAVLDRHIPSGKGNEACAKGNVGAFQRGMFQIRHVAASLRAGLGLVNLVSGEEMNHGLQA